MSLTLDFNGSFGFSEVKKNGVGRPKVDRETIVQAVVDYCRKRGLSKDDLREHDFRLIVRYYSLDCSTRTVRRVLPEIENFVVESKPQKFLDYPIVKKWLEERINDVKLGRVSEKQIKKYIDWLEKVWRKLNYKAPQNWEKKDVEGILPDFSESMRPHIVIAVRQIRPDLMSVLRTKGLWETENVKRRRVEVEQELVRLIDEEGRLKTFLDVGYDFERLVKYLHITTGAREGYDRKGGLLSFDWKYVDWVNGIIRWYESKTKDWFEAPLDLFGSTCKTLLYNYWVSQGKPREGLIFPKLNQQKLTEIYKKSSKACGIEIHPHYADKIHISLLAKMGVDFTVAISGKLGRGWKKVENALKYYLVFSRKKLQEELEKAKGLGL